MAKTRLRAKGKPNSAPAGTPVPATAEKPAQTTTPKPTPQPAHSRFHFPFYPAGIVVFLVLFLLDQYTKYAIRASYPLGLRHEILPGVWFTHVANTGTVWGLFNGTNANLFFIWLSIAAFGLLLYYHDEFTTTIEKIAFILIMAGLWGNLFDRAIFGYVLDFIDLGWWPVFNIADSCISVAIVLFMLEQWRRYRTHTPHQPSPDDATKR
jgi:signal peptidase II